MARQRYIQHPETLELIPAEEYVRPSSDAPMILGDLQPYKSMITGEMINGRRQHREHLRQHGCIEVGNEKIGQRREVSVDRSALKRAAHEALSRHGF